MNLQLELQFVVLLLQLSGIFQNPFDLFKNPKFWVFSWGFQNPRFGGFFCMLTNGEFSNAYYLFCLKTLDFGFFLGDFKTLDFVLYLLIIWGVLYVYNLGVCK